MNHSRYVEWQTPSYGGFSLDKLGVIEYLNGYFVVHTVLIIALVRGQETSVVSVQCKYIDVQLGAEYKVALQRIRWTRNVDTVIQRIMMTLVKQLIRSLYHHRRDSAATYLLKL